MKGIYQLFIALMAAIMILAVICGPYSCEWGNPVYFFTGLLITVVLSVVPFFIQKWPPGKRTLHSLLFLFSCVMVWCGGFMLGGFTILCRLFYLLKTARQVSTKLSSAGAVNLYL